MGHGRPPSDEPSDPVAQVVAFYGQGTFERDRLTYGRGRLELERTLEILGRELPPPPAAVLDVGGGPGTYAAWLARDGYDVELVDVTPALVEQARERSAGRPERPFRARVGDARTLDVEPGAWDAVLLLGPLYHLPDAADRLLALRAAHRALRPGGVLVAAAIGRFTALLDVARMGLLTAESEDALLEAVRTGRWSGARGFTTAYFHRPEELADEVAEAGLVDVRILPVEGPAWWLFPAEARDGSRVVPTDDRLLDAALTCAQATEGEPSLLGASAHLVAVARRPTASDAASG